MLADLPPDSTRISGPALALRALVCLAMLALAAGFLYGMQYFAGAADRMEHQPLVTNMTAARTESRLFLGTLPDCAAAESSCWLSPAFDDAAWTAAVLPTFDLKGHPDYDATRTSGFVHYRLRVPVSPELLADGGEISFTPVYVMHERYEIFVNGRLVHTGNGSSYAGSVVNVPLPRADVQGATVAVAIRGRLAAGDEGIFHRSALFVGPKKDLDAVHMQQEWAMRSYFLLLLLAKGSVFIVFALFFLFRREGRTLGSFLLFAACVTAESLLAGEFVTAWLDLNVRALLFFVLKAVAITALLTFLAHQLDAAPLRRWIAAAGALLALVMAGLAWDYAWGSHSVSIGFLFSLSNVAYVVALGLGALLCGLALRRLEVRGGTRHRRAAVRALTVAVTAYFALCAWEFFVNPFLGFDKRPFFDLLFFYVIAYATARELGLKERMLRVQMEELAKARINAAIARNTQMLAHDVRKPFSLLRSLLHMLREDRQALSRVPAYLAEVEAAIAVVDAMVLDVMAMGAEPALVRQTTSVRTLLGKSVEQAVRAHGGADATIEWDLRHHRSADLDEPRLRRVLSNIITNALEAMDSPGRIWLRTRDVTEGGRDFVEVAIGNTGSFVPPDALPRLFDAYYTAGKANGTGLGLAIAHKFVTLHGGRIWCVSSEQLGTEFWLTLPASPVGETDLPELPTTIGSAAQPLADRQGASAHPAADAELPLIAVVDDSVFVLESWQTVAKDAEVLIFSSPEEFWTEIGAKPGLLRRLRCVVTDLHFGDMSPTSGEDFATALRSATGVAVVLSSDSHSPGDPSRSMPYDGVIDKVPMAWAELRQRVPEPGR